MSQLYQDFMAIDHHFGNTSLSRTMIAHANENEVQDDLLPGQTASNCQDLECQVYQLKERHV
jgi:hypothetical protein